VLASTAGFRLAERFDEVGFSDIVQIRNRVMELKAQGAAVYQFEGGEPFRPTPDYIKAAATAALTENKTRYAPSSGIPELRQAIAGKLRDRNRINVETDRIILVNGGMQGLFAALQSVVNPGDEVIVTSPGFSSYTEQVMLAGGVPKYLPLDESRGWAMKLDVLPKLITPKTKAMILNSPCNPTGGIFTKTELAAIADTVLKHNLILITDEPYSFLLFDGAELPELVSDDRLRHNRISCFSFSKEYAMTGYRVGYVFAEEGMIRQMMKVHDAFIVSAPRPSQVAALAAIKGDQSCVEELRKTLEQRRDIMCGHFDRMKKWFSYVKPKGA